MRHMRRETCPVCDGARTVPDDEMSTGMRVCGECLGHGTKDVDADAPCCDVLTRTEITPAETL